MFDATKIIAATMPKSRDKVWGAVARLKDELREQGFDIAPDADEGLLQSVLGNWRRAAEQRLSCDLPPLNDLWRFFWDCW
jgi:hypothetical protein